MALFGKKETPFLGDMARPSLGPPTDLVIGMRQQGLTNNQIVQNLQRDGYGSDQIFDAMSQADIRGGVQPMAPQQAPAGQAPYPDEGMEFPGGGMPFGPPPGPVQMGRPQMEDSNREKIEEIAEAIIEEKWTELVGSVNKVVEWKNKTEAKMEAFEQKIDTLQKSFDELQKAIVGKIGEYDRNIIEVGTEVQAMQRVFKQVLPTFTENVHELSRLVSKSKDLGVKKKSSKSD